MMHEKLLFSEKFGDFFQIVEMACGTVPRTLSTFHGVTKTLAAAVERPSPSLIVDKWTPSHLDFPSVPCS